MPRWVARGKERAGTGCSCRSRPSEGGTADVYRQGAAEALVYGGGSIGVAVFLHKIGTPEELVGNADAAHYKARLAGEDRVEVFS
jgi:GGDEF domain-containing protein